MINGHYPTVLSRNPTIRWLGGWHAVNAGVLGSTDITQGSYDVTQRSDILAGGMLWIQARPGSSTRLDETADFELDLQLLVSVMGKLWDATSLTWRKLLYY